MERALMLLLDTNILIDVLRGEAVALAWLEEQQQPHISVITWIEVLVAAGRAKPAACTTGWRASLACRWMTRSQPKRWCCVSSTA
jgi:predicted nucleic acid-binding protein